MTPNAAREGEEVSKTGRTRVVYIVDPDESVRQGLSRLVASARLDPKPYGSIDEFLRQVPEAGIACALLDVAGPRLREPAVRLQVRKIAAALPVIALSADDDPETRRMARGLGAQAFFRKPVDAAALLDSIDWVTRAEG